MSGSRSRRFIYYERSSTSRHDRVTKVAIPVARHSIAEDETPPRLIPKMLCWISTGPGYKLRERDDLDAVAKRITFLPGINDEQFVESQIFQRNPH